MDETEEQQPWTEEELQANDLAFHVYPNPANNILNINTSYLSGSNQLRVFDYNGRVVLQLNNLSGNNHTLDISNLSAAIYIVELTANGETQRQKLVVQ